MFTKELQDLMDRYDVSIYRVYDDEKQTDVELVYKENNEYHYCKMTFQSCDRIKVLK